MERVAKKITLKRETLKDIECNNINTQAFIERIKGYLTKANYLINNKMIYMSNIEFYSSLREVFNIYFDPKDYLRMLSMMNHKHYTKLININTTMYNSDDFNVSYLCAVVPEHEYLDGLTIDLKTLRKLTDSNKLFLLEPKYEKKEKVTDRKERFESHLIQPINVRNREIDETSPLFPYAASLTKKKTVIKNVLFDLKLYVDEVIYQARAINGLALVEDNDAIARIGRQYKRAYDKAHNDRELPKKEKIAVRYHVKSKKKNNKKKK